MMAPKAAAGRRITRAFTGKHMKSNRTVIRGFLMTAPMRAAVLAQRAKTGSTPVRVAMP